MSWTDSLSMEDLAEEIHQLEFEVAELRQLEEGRLEQECRRCHRIFRGLPEERWCTRDCEMGWTPAPTYEEWYRTLHP